MSISEEKLKKYAKAIHQTAKEKGWWDKKRNRYEVYALINTELSEAIEADREGRLADIVEFEEEHARGGVDEKDIFKACIKDTIEDELADALIRALDWLYFKNNEYIIIPNHGIEWEDNFAANIFMIQRKVCNLKIDEAASAIIDFCDMQEIPLEWHVVHKMRYNGMRPKMHGGKKY